MTYIPWEPNAQIADSINHPIFQMEYGAYERLLRDVIRLCPYDLSDHRSPLLIALLRALQDITGGPHKSTLTTYQPGLIFYLSYLVYYGERSLPVETEKNDSIYELYGIVKSFEKTVAEAIRDRTYLQYRDEGVYLGNFQIPQWFYEQES